MVHVTYVSLNCKTCNCSLTCCHGNIARCVVAADCPKDPSLVLILKWGGELTPAGKIQAEKLGQVFRCMYPGGEGWFVSLHLGLLLSSPAVLPVAWRDNNNNFICKVPLIWNNFHSEAHKIHCNTYMFNIVEARSTIMLFHWSLSKCPRFHVTTEQLSVELVSTGQLSKC